MKPVKVQVGAATAFSKTPTLDDVNAKLREEAVKLGANGIIRTAYDRGVTLRSWKGLKATGVAVVFETQGGSSDTTGTAAELERLAPRSRSIDERRVRGREAQAARLVAGNPGDDATGAEREGASISTAARVPPLLDWFSLRSLLESPWRHSGSHQSPDD